jgi:hypothetical protein
LTNFAINRANRTGGPKSFEVSGKRGTRRAGGDGDIDGEDDADVETVDGSGAGAARAGWSSAGAFDSDDEDSAFDPFSYDYSRNPVLQETLGIKWSLTALFRVLKSNGVDTSRLWRRLSDIIAKTILSIRPKAAHLYRSSRGPCRLSTAQPGEEEQGFFSFELLGFDVLLNDDMTPILLEVNQVRQLCRTALCVLTCSVNIVVILPALWTAEQLHAVPGCAVPFIRNRQ